MAKAMNMNNVPTAIGADLCLETTFVSRHYADTVKGLGDHTIKKKFYAKSFFVEFKISFVKRPGLPTFKALSSNL